jgi:hypothetical protein
MEKIKTSGKKALKLYGEIVSLIDTIGCDYFDVGCVCGMIAARAAHEKMTRDTFTGLMGVHYDAEKIAAELHHGINKELNEIEANYDHH